jgi:pyridoxal phosphate enzyme (YggS family)
MSIRENLEKLNNSIEAAALKAGRSSSEIRLMAVSKTKPLELIREAYDAGQRLFGENRVAEAQEKFASLPEDVDLHLIGHLQRNKVKTGLSVFDCIQSLDSRELAEKLVQNYKNQIHEMKDLPIRVLLQLKTAEEGSKTGFSSEEEIIETAGWLREQQGVRIEGLMTIAPVTDDESVVREAFARCRILQEKLMSLYRDQDFSVLSMGMSSDFEWAVLEGSTLLRVGSALFGGRF